MPDVLVAGKVVCNGQPRAGVRVVAVLGYRQSGKFNTVGGTETVESATSGANGWWVLKIPFDTKHTVDISSFGYVNVEVHCVEGSQKEEFQVRQCSAASAGAVGKEIVKNIAVDVLTKLLGKKIPGSVLSTDVVGYLAWHGGATSKAIDCCE